MRPKTKTTIKMATKYQKDDQKGREIFKAFVKENPEFKFIKESKDEFSPWDVSFTNKRENYIGEIKIRKYKSTTFNDWYLQTDKYEKLKELQSKIPNSKISYINFFDDNMTLIWNLDEIDFSKIETGLRELQENDYDETTVLKPVFLLPHSLAHKFETEQSKSIFNKIEELKAKYQQDEEEDKFPF